MYRCEEMLPDGVYATRISKINTPRKQRRTGFDSFTVMRDTHAAATASANSSTFRLAFFPMLSSPHRIGFPPRAVLDHFAMVLHEREQLHRNQRAAAR